MLQFIWSIPEAGNPPEEKQYVLRGGICIRTQTGDFPCSRWQGFPIMQIANFLANAASLVRTPNSIPRHHPFHSYDVMVTPPIDGMLTLRFLRSYAPEALEKLPPLVLSFREYREILLETGRRMLDVCRARGIGIASELHYLENGLHSLQALTPEKASPVSLRESIASEKSMKPFNYFIKERKEVSMHLDTIPVVCLPHRVQLRKERSLHFLQSVKDVNTLVLRIDQQRDEFELPDVLVDIIWCYSSEHEVLVIGSEYGRYVYFIDIFHQRIIQKLEIKHTENNEWVKCIIQVTPDQRRVIVHTESKVMVLTWQGTILLEHVMVWNDTLKSIEPNTITFYDPGTSDDGEFTIPIPE